VAAILTVPSRHGISSEEQESGAWRCYHLIMNRWPDWWNQALRDLEHAGQSIANEHYEWASFAAQQAAEKALKAVILSLGGEPWGHSVTSLAESVQERLAVDRALVEAASRLDKHYLPTRYPNGFPAGHPGKLYTEGEAAGALSDAETIIEFCRGHLPRP
jgi:HEPN domain-containing protein